MSDSYVGGYLVTIVSEECVVSVHSSEILTTGLPIVATLKIRTQEILFSLDSR
jgi:hypothetical protein